MVLKVSRTKLIVSSYAPTSFKTHFNGMSLGYFFDYLLPLRLGQLFRAYYVSNRDKISFGFLIVAIFFEKCVDILFMTSTLGIIFLLDEVQVNYSALIFLSLSVFFLLTIGISISFALVQSSFLLRMIYRVTNKLNDEFAVRVRHSLWSTFFALGQITKQRKLLIKYFALALTSWCAYLAALYMLFSSFAESEENLSDFFNSLVSNGISLPYAQTFLGGVAALGEVALETTSLFQPNGMFAEIAWWLIYPSFITLGFFINLQFIKSNNFTNYQAKQYALDSYNDDTYHDRKFFVQNYFANKKIYLSIHNELYSKQINVKRYFSGGSNAITLLLDNDGILRVRKCIEIVRPLLNEQRVAVVVSAIGGKPKVTDLLLDSVHAAANGKVEESQRLLQMIHEKHIIFSKILKI
jgi:hypothetical protein